jgi:hypothetical protein
MTLQKRLKRYMRRHEMRVADLARELGRPYTTVREWVLNGREPGGEFGQIESRLRILEGKLR